MSLEHLTMPERGRAQEEGQTKTKNHSDDNTNRIAGWVRGSHAGDNRRIWRPKLEPLGQPIKWYWIITPRTK